MFLFLSLGQFFETIIFAINLNKQTNKQTNKQKALWE